MLTTTQRNRIPLLHDDHPFLGVFEAFIISSSHSFNALMKALSDEETLAELISWPQTGQIAVRLGSDSPQAGHLTMLPAYV
jgi:hypothetical protein